MGKQEEQEQEEGEKINAQSCSQPIQCAQLSTFLIQRTSNKKTTKNNVHRQKLGPKTNAHSRHKFWVDVPNTNIDLKSENK